MPQSKLIISVDLIAEYFLCHIPPIAEKSLFERHRTLIATVVTRLPWRPRANSQTVRALSKDASEYAATRYLPLRSLLSIVNREDVFIDLGCGDGRVLRFVAARRKLASIIGVELVPELARVAQIKASMSRLLTPIHIVNTNAAHADLSTGTLYYLNNPFGSETLTKVIRNISASLVKHPRRIRIIYYHPMWAKLLDNISWLRRDREIEKRLNRNLSGDYVIYVWDNRI